MIERNGELHRFLNEEIGSEETLDIVMFLVSQREHRWSIEEIRDRLVIAADATSGAGAIATKRIELRLEKLEQQRIVRRDAGSTWRYADGNQYEESIATLAAMQRESLTEASRLIYLRPRTSLDAFADAFGPRNPS